MDIQELRALCAEAARTAPGHIYLAHTRKSPPRGARVALFVSFGPYGEHCNSKPLDNGEWQTLAVYDAAKVVRWIDKHLAQREA